MKTLRERVTPILDYILSHFTKACLVYMKIRFRFTKPDNRILALKNAYKGRRCFVIGLGPSLTVSDLDLLARNSEYTFSMNRCYRLFDKTSWRPDFYVVTDAKACTSETMNAIDTMVHSGTIVAYSRNEITGMPSEALYFKTDFSDFVLRNSHKKKYLEQSHACLMSTDAYDRVYAGASCSHTIIQLAYYMGFSEVYLLGTDCGTGSNQQSYCSGLGTVKNDAYIKGEGNIMIRDFQSLKDDIAHKKIDFHIYNCSRGGALEVFPRCNLEEILSV